MIELQRIKAHRSGDDPLTAGLGLDGLRAMPPPGLLWEGLQPRRFSGRVRRG